MKIFIKSKDAIDYFTKKTRNVPMKFKITQDGEYIAVNVDKITSINSNISDRDVYRCQSSTNGKSRIFDLQYDINKCSWNFYRV